MMNRTEITAKTLAVFRNIFGKEVPLSENSSANDIDRWDSLNHILLIQELEKVFEIKFDLFEIIFLKDVKGIIEYISSKIER
jgi:acyl carrier protein